MRRLRRFFKKAFTPITIMIVPHSRSKLLRLKIPFSLLIAVPALWGFGTFYVLTVGVQTARYTEMSKQLSYFSGEFLQIRSTLLSLQTADQEFRRLFSLKSKKKVLEAVSTNETGTPDLELLKRQVDEAMASVAEIRRYIQEERDAYFATPTGWPAPGALSSGFGKRASPQTGEPAFHSGVDIRVPSGTPVRVTADGIVVV